MAKSPNGPFGQLNGKLRNLVFYTLNGQPIVRTIGINNKKPSKAQLANYQAMAVTMDLLRPIKDFINSSFELEAQGTVKNQHNLATAYNKKQALQGAYPDIRINYSKVVFSYGDLPVSTNLKLAKAEKGVYISWESNEGLDDDIVMVMLYHPLQKDATYTLNASRRDAEQCFLRIWDPAKQDEPIEAYICFKSADGKCISNSVYLGNLNGEAK